MLIRFLIFVSILFVEEYAVDNSWINKSLRKELAIFSISDKILA